VSDETGRPAAEGARPGGSPDDALPVRDVSALIGGWVGKLGQVWIEGQVAELKVRPGASLAFCSLRDTTADSSLPVAVPVSVLRAAPTQVVEGSRVVVLAKPEWWGRRGELQLKAHAIRPVGLGELLARLEHLRSVLAAEGLFDPARKRPLPFLPHRVGLVCGRASAAMTDVLENARLRWPGVEFEVREVAVQGPQAVPAVVAALRELDVDAGVDVIVVARGGGSFEDLLPFSDEGLVRAVAECTTPVVSAIGHEQDTPLLDHVADVRASTPTDAARRVVPDVREQAALVGRWRDAGRRTAVARLENESRRLAVLAGHPALRDPSVLLAARAADVASLRARSAREAAHDVEQLGSRLQGLAGRLRTLSPQGTLDRGYAVVRTDVGAVVRDAGAVAAGAALRVRVASGEFGATVAPVA
jgi:exodeoxyribonuclease VII large subunit